MLLSVLALGCSGVPANRWLPPDAATHRVTVDPALSGKPDAPAVILYADVDGDPAADVCLRVWGDARWTIAEGRARPGLFDAEIASGRVDAGGVLDGSLDGFFHGARAIWRSGLERTEVWIDGIPVPETGASKGWALEQERHSVPQVPTRN